VWLLRRAIAASAGGRVGRRIPCEKVKHPDLQLPKRSERGGYDDRASLAGRRFIEERD